MKNMLSPEKEKQLKADVKNILANHRRTLLTRYPFIGAIAMNMELVPVRDIRMRTACTDNKSIFFDIAFLSSLSPEEALFVLGHEVFHSVMMHFARTENRDRYTMNIATDLEVNQILVKDGFCLPKIALMPNLFGMPADLSAEQYYELLKQKSEQQNKDTSAGGQFDKHIYSGDDLTQPGQGQSKEDAEAEAEGQDISDKYGKVGFDPDFTPGDPKAGVERVREAAVAAAQMVERTRGSLPAHIKGLVEALLKPEIDWREQLQQFVTRTCSGESRNWNPPNRRHVHSGIYLQSRKGEKIRVVAGLDVSGSTASDIPKFLGELNGLVKSFGQYELTVIQVDTEVKSAVTYSDDNPLDLENEKFEVVGGGGTRLTPAFEYIEANKDELEPDAILILTDGYTEKFTEDMDPGVPVMWVVTKDGTTENIGFGDVVQMKNSK